MVTTGKLPAPAATDTTPQAAPGARPWLGRTEDGFHRAAGLLKDCCAPQIREAYRACCQADAAEALHAVLTAPAPVLAIADLHMWMSETFVSQGGKEHRAPWRQVIDLAGAVERISRVIEFAALAVRGEGTITVRESPCSLPGLGVRIDQGPGEWHVGRTADGWRSDEGPLPPLETFQMYGATVLVDGDVPWITEPALMLRAGRVYASRLSTAHWVWGDALRESAELIERALGEAGRPIAEVVHTVVPVEVPDIPFNSWTNTVSPGALYVTKIQRPFVLAELIVHEAAHTWLSELDYLKPTTNEGYADLRLYSPYRKKGRPAYAVLHGVIAHAWVSRFWRNLRDAETGAHSFLARMRCEQVESLVGEGVDSLSTVHDAISPYGWELVKQSDAR